MKSDSHAFVTFRVAGDTLDPKEVTQILSVPPTHAHRKGETYQPGRRGKSVTGSTGVWFVSTDNIVHSNRLDEHLAYIASLLDTRKTRSLHNLVNDKHLTAALTCFWHGARSSEMPLVPPEVEHRMSEIPARIETDFATEDA
jgi:hypothetical protein